MGKTQSYLILFLGIFGIFVSGLAAGSNSKAKKPVRSASYQKDTVWIAKPDGALSCEPDSGRTLSQDAEELKKAKITVLESKKGNDGKMHVQMCGAATGSLNSFLIPKAKLSDALALGYGQLKAGS